MTDSELNSVIIKFFEDNHPELIITQRILNNLRKTVKDGLQGVASSISLVDAAPAVDRFLQKDNVLRFVSNRQPNVEPVSQETFQALESYMKDHLGNNRILYVFRKSNHREDDYLYSAVGYNIATQSYCCWSSWNMSTLSLNNGHYGLSSIDSAVSILQDLYNDVTDEPEKYGMMSNCYSNLDVVMAEIEEEQRHRQSEMQEQQDNENVILINQFNRRGR